MEEYIQNNFWWCIYLLVGGIFTAIEIRYRWDFDEWFTKQGDKLLDSGKLPPKFEWSVLKAKDLKKKKAVQQTRKFAWLISILMIPIWPVSFIGYPWAIWSLRHFRKSCETKIKATLCLETPEGEWKVGELDVRKEGTVFVSSYMESLPEKLKPAAAKILIQSIKGSCKPKDQGDMIKRLDLEKFNA